MKNHNSLNIDAQITSNLILNQQLINEIIPFDFLLITVFLVTIFQLSSVILLLIRGRGHLEGGRLRSTRLK
jgi:hypothetical protein